MEIHNTHNENEEVDMGMGMGMGIGGSSGSSRWNPTKEQISMLENLYKQGIRTPSAEEIQHITARLRVYGHIEGKNVFYWFQNHKARQRQKQKQETIAYFNRFLHRPQPIFTAPICPNVLCPPYCMPQAQGEMGYYHQHPKVLLPVGIRRSPSEKFLPMGMSSTCNDPLVYEGMQPRISGYNLSYSNQETLDLFPVHPTGILGGKTTYDQVSSLASVSADSSTDIPFGSSDYVNENGDCSGDKPFFDFFTFGQGSQVSD
ncbi:hypothetical protein Lal_00019863 [Lupinus albus]|uniref:Putative transcription factor homeobox-WOX family n=1 Tax=Lupinus albus TaxID=3870 RepID=A0A6A4R3A2_LUPAL|nr:putative transcription factor homeobox-WOX family [Lupinus albus]KAF1899732.1 hypothetical protein Lal_00019863 [Lupinus albus]